MRISIQFVKRLFIATAIAFFAATSPPRADAQEVYRLPAARIVDLVDALPPPGASLSPDGRVMLLVQSAGLPSIDELAEPMLRLAGTRLDPKTNGRHGAGGIEGLSLVRIADGHVSRVPMPDNPRLSFPVWSHSLASYAFTHTTRTGIELWVGEGGIGRTKRMTEPVLNGTLSSGFTWMPDGKSLLLRLVPDGRGPAPEPAALPIRPVIRESRGAAAAKPTYQDLLKNPADEALFAYYATSQLAILPLQAPSPQAGQRRRSRRGRGRPTPIGAPGIFTGASPSPSGEFLLITRLTSPMSYLVPYRGFARTTEIWNMQGEVLQVISEHAPDDGVPLQGVPTGRRSIGWRPNAPATLAWAEALDGGDPENEVPNRDKIMMLAAPFTGNATEIARTEHRYSGLAWREKGGQALLSEYDRDRRWRTTWLIDADEPGANAKKIWDLSVQDAYNHPGSPMIKRNDAGQSVLREHAGAIYLAGRGASPDGARPFLDRLDLTNLSTERLFRSSGDSYESVIGLVSDDAGSFVTQYETENDTPNYFLRSAGSEAMAALTDFPDPAKWLKDIRKEIVKYKRADGVELSGTLYLPTDYEEGKRYPMIIWAYPREFNDARMASQVRGSQHRYTRIGGPSHLFFLTQGYVVFDGPAMPVIGEVETANDTYVEQIVSSAKAAIDKAVELGVADPDRVGIGGHSYGAFMAGNLLAHSDLFRAGIARSGAYNRTLTPFGFQNERRTFWEAPDTYFAMSPFMHAQKVNEPILLIHGEADNNTGTYPIQSDRYFAALKGNGATVRYVSLPHESHGYRARESVLHVLAEMIDWADRYVKDPAPPVTDVAR